jgi:MoxR-like ATPase
MTTETTTAPEERLGESIEAVIEATREAGYLADRGLATAIFLAIKLRRPLLLEGEAGVGKTAVAQVLAELLSTRLIRLQCYEGIDLHQALYEWDHARQLVQIRLAEATGHASTTEVEHTVFSERFLIRRPLLQALDDSEGTPVLLIDEIDRADDEFEAFLLEFLAEFAVTIPELGRIAANRPPIIIITSNRVRELHDALKRRCLYHWIDHPDFERALAILRVRLPGLPERLARQVAGAVRMLQDLDLYKTPGVAEMIDWAQSLVALGVTELDETSASDSLGAVLKYHEDLATVRGRLDEIMAAARNGSA